MIYYIACSATLRMKIGYTQGEPEVRLKQLQTGSASDLRLIACHPGTIEHERELHQKFAAQRVRGEWFEMNEDLFEHLSMVVWLVAAECAATETEPPQWVRIGLRAMQDGNPKPMPQHVAQFL